jgi:hypothetical protein
MKATNARHGRILAGIICSTLLLPVAPFAAPNPPQVVGPAAAFAERSWRLDRVSMFNQLLGRMDGLIDHAKKTIQIGTMAGSDLPPILEARTNLELSAKNDASAPPSRPTSDAAVLALKARFNEALIEVDHQVLWLSVGTAPASKVTAAIMSASSILR